MPTLTKAVQVLVQSQGLLWNYFFFFISPAKNWLSGQKNWFSEQHQHFAGLEQRTAYIGGLGTGLSWPRTN